MADNYKGQRNEVRVLRKDEKRQKETPLKCLCTNACSLGNKQEELELHLWTQNSEIIGKTVKW